MIREILSLERLVAMEPSAAAALLAVRRSDGGTAHDEAMLHAWLQASEANVRAWDQTQAGLRAFDDAGDDELLMAMRRAAIEARPARAFAPQRLAAAAVVLVILTGALLGLFLRAPSSRPSAPTPPSAEAPAQTFATADRQRATFSLADGSRMTLDGDSKVVVAFSSTRRDLRLRQGHAFFEVARDAARPFAVAAGDRQVVAVGTKFDVRVDPGRMRVVLVEGRVSVGSPRSTAAPTLLKAGQQLEAQTGRPPVVSTADIDAVLDWQQGFVTFDDMPLSEVVKVLNQGGPDQLAVGDPRIAGLRISGRFKTGDIARFGRTLAQVHPVRLVETAPHRFEIVPAG
jgi:transmembrane sensor